MESQCSFDLHFLYGCGCWMFLHVFIGHLYFFFENYLSSSFAHLLIGGFWYLIFWFFIYSRSSSLFNE
jgi:hypothetical protein